jgi:hypothetical protein
MLIEFINTLKGILEPDFFLQEPWLLAMSRSLKEMDAQHHNPAAPHRSRLSAAKEPEGNLKSFA